jgi:hypothetical protein
VQTGGPVVICVTLFLVLGISLLRGRSNTPNVNNTASVQRYAPTTATPGYGYSPGSPSYSPAPSTFSPAPIPAGPSLPVLNVNAAMLRPSEDEIRYAELQQLRRMTAYVDSYVEAQEYARSIAARSVSIQQGRAAYQFSGPAAMQTEAARPAL